MPEYTFHFAVIADRPLSEKLLERARGVAENAATRVLAMASDAEAAHEKTSADVTTVLDHLRHNRTTEREARDLSEAARRSLADHATAKSMGRLP